MKTDFLWIESILLKEKYKQKVLHEHQCVALREMEIQKKIYIINNMTQ